MDPTRMQDTEEQEKGRAQARQYELDRSRVRWRKGLGGKEDCVRVRRRYEVAREKAR